MANINQRHYWGHLEPSGIIVDETRISLPKNWENVSNFSALQSDLETLSQHRWYPIQSVDDPNYNYKTMFVSRVYYEFDPDNKVILEKYVIADIPVVTAEQLEAYWEMLRHERDRLMSEFEWRYVRYEREVRLGLPTSDRIEDLDAHMQALADFTNSTTDPYQIIFPEYNPTPTEE